MDSPLMIKKFLKNRLSNTMQKFAQTPREMPYY